MSRPWTFSRNFARAMASSCSSLASRASLTYAASVALHAVALGGALVWCISGDFAGSLELDGGGGIGGDSIPPGAPGGSAGASVMYFQLPAASPTAAEAVAEPMEQPAVEPLIATQTQVAEISPPALDQIEPTEISNERSKPASEIAVPVVKSPGPRPTQEALQRQVPKPPPAAQALPDLFSEPLEMSSVPRRVASAPPSPNKMIAEIPPEAVAGGNGSGVGTGTGPRTGVGSGAGGAGGDVDSLPGTGSGNRKPVYPLDALQARIEGRVILLVDVRPDGTVAAAKVDQSAGWPSLDDSALAAVKAWRFSPARRGGVPVAFSVRVPVVFNIAD